MSFSETLTAEKFVIPVARRAAVRLATGALIRVELSGDRAPGRAGPMAGSGPRIDVQGLCNGRVGMTDISDRLLNDIVDAVKEIGAEGAIRPAA